MSSHGVIYVDSQFISLSYVIGPWMYIWNGVWKFNCTSIDPRFTEPQVINVMYNV
jgi:hypothetical protein